MNGGRDPQRHREKMARKAAARERIMATKQTTKGLFIVHTGKGKGKSTAAFGMILRALGHGFAVSIVQFIKGGRETGEREALRRFGDQARFFACGEGFTWETQDRNRDEALAARAWAEAEKALADARVRMVLLDELNVALRYGYLPQDVVLERIAARPEGQHVIVTGRNAPPALLEAADLVTEMHMIRHPFRAGVKAQPGVEY